MPTKDNVCVRFAGARHCRFGPPHLSPIGRHCRGSYGGDAEEEQSHPLLRYTYTQCYPQMQTLRCCWLHIPNCLALPIFIDDDEDDDEDEDFEDDDEWED